MKCVQKVPANVLCITKAQQNIPKGFICFAPNLSSSAWLFILFSTGRDCLSRKSTFTCIGSNKYRGPNYRVIPTNITHCGFIQILPRYILFCKTCGIVLWQLCFAMYKEY